MFILHLIIITIFPFLPFFTEFLVLCNDGLEICHDCYFSPYLLRDKLHKCPLCYIHFTGSNNVVMFVRRELGNSG